MNGNKQLVSKGWSKEYLVFFFAGLFYFIFLFFTDGVAGGGDTYTHYFMAKYAAVHPELFLNQWGKPVFTTLFFPFAQIGLKAVELVNLTLIFFQGFILLKIARILNYKSIWVVPFLFFTTPVVFENSVSALTEILFGFSVILFLYLILKNKLFWALLVISWLPFIRSEGFILILLVCIYLCWYKRWYFIPILFTGTFILNTIGGIYSGEWLWLFESNPYINTEITAYGNGSIFHFFIWGVPVFGLGFILFISRTMSHYFKRKFWIQLVSEPFLSQQSIQVWFFHGFFWCFFLAHVMLWWLGMWASLGLTRVMFCIVGPFVLLLYQEIALSKLIVTNNKWVKMKRVGIAICLISPVIASSAFLGLLGFPTGFGTEEVVLQKALSKSNFLQTESTAFYAHPYCATVLNRDPFDSKSCQRIENFLNAKPGDVIIWDGHFAPNEHRVNLSELQQDSSLIFLGMYAPNRAYKPLNGIPFEVYLFTKK